MIYLILKSALIISIYATIWFVVSLIKKRNDVADVAWGLGYILLCIFYFITQEFSQRTLLLYSLVIIWGLRLFIHIYLRNKGKSEDFRYLKWRQEWGKWFYLRSYFQIYLFQGFFLLLIIFPVTLTSSNPQPSLNYLDFIGLFIWLFGFYFEAVGDYELVQFKKDSNNKGKVLKTGLWQYTRHPNYFGEVTMWWGIFIIALSSPNGFYALISPLTITFLIVFVSGIPMLEKKYQGNIEFEEYKKQTNKFFPWFKKKI